MVFRNGLLNPGSVATTQENCQDPWPFPHFVVQDVIEEDFLRRVRNEINSNLLFNFEENHVYRIRRSTHLANISNPNEFSLDLLPNLIRLRDALYSLKFREWLSSVTGVGPLSGVKSSMAVNLYTPGDHLLVHDDCNSKSKNRRVSFILYLTDPDNAWRWEWGGGLRLYSSERKKNANGDLVKVTLPQWSKCIQPCFNQLTIFAVRPGETYHEVEEVHYSGNVINDQERRRLAVSGWFHAAQEGDEVFDRACYLNEMQKVERLHQLKATVHYFHEPQTIFIPFDSPKTDISSTGCTLSQHEADFLSHYLAPQLLARAQLEQMSECFSQTLILQIDSFLCEHFAMELKDYILTLDQRNGKANGLRSTSPGWKSARPPEVHRYLYLEGSTVSLNRGTPISQLLDNLLRSYAFKKWLALATGFALSNIDSQHTIARRFRRGLDYILADAHDRKQPQLDYTLNITPMDHVHAGVGSPDELSGEEIYMPAKDDAVELMFAGRNFRTTQDDGSGYKNCISWNKLSVMLRCDGMQSFVKYVSHAASGERWDIKGKVMLTSDATRILVEDE